MIVYHGSNSDIDVINLSRGSRFKDFGQGFYVTQNVDTAKRMAEKKTRFYGGEKTIIEYEFDESALNVSDLKVLVFPERATAEDLQDKYLDQQICFRTEQSLNYLKKTSVCRIK